MTDTKTIAPARDAAGRLQKNHGLGGRRPGSSERDLIRAEAQPHRAKAVALLAAAVDRALASPDAIDNAAVKAAQELLDRLAARPKAQDERVRIPGLKEAQDIDAKCQAVVAAVADGSVSVNAGRQALAMLADVARVLEVGTLERRLRAIEAQLGLTPKPIEGDIV